MSESKGSPKATANITIRYKELDTASAVLKAVTPDNFSVPQGVTIKSEKNNSELCIKISCSTGLGRLTSTIDDLLSCIQAAEKAINGVL